MEYLHLKDKYSISELRFGSYLDSKVTLEMSETLRDLDYLISKSIDRIYKEILGEEWRKRTLGLTFVYKYEFRLVCPNFLQPSVFSTSVYFSKEKYPRVLGLDSFDLNELLTSEEYDQALELMIKISGYKNKLIDEIDILGLLKNDKEVTWGFLKEKCPDLFDWAVQRKFDNEEVRIITEEEDLKELRRCLPEIMI